MDNVPKHETIFDIADHLWPYISALSLTIIAILKLWWSSRRRIHARINNLEIIAENMEHIYVTKHELNECRNDVQAVDDKNLDQVFSEMKDIKNTITEYSKANTEQHQHIMDHIVNIKKD